MIQNLTNNLLTQNTRVERAFHHIQQALNGAKNFIRERRGVDSACRHRRLEQFVFANIHQQLLQLKNIHVDANTGQRNRLCRESFTFKG
ncbi:hypothetical protein D3C86_2059550 [compost metagenome]